MMKNRITLIVLIALLAVVSALPLFVGGYFLHIATMILFYSYLAQAWNIMSGFSGQFSFGHAAFFGIGAYLSSTLFVTFGLSPWIGMLIGALAAGIIGGLIGFLTFRYQLKGAYFALATLAFAEIFRVIVENTGFFHKTMGILIPLSKSPAQFQFQNGIGYYYVILILVLCITAAVYWMSRSRLGFNLIAIRENEDAAKSLGVKTFQNKTLAISLSAALTAVGGTFYAQFLLYIDPVMAFGNDTSIDILLPAIIGGAGTVFGPLLGAVLTVPLKEITSSYFAQYPGFHLIVYGIVVIAVMLYVPEGIVGWLEENSGRLKGLRLGRSKNTPPTNDHADADKEEDHAILEH